MQKAEQELRRLLDSDAFKFLTTPLPPARSTYDLPAPDDLNIPPVIKFD
jgi:hypothetical protein